MISSNFSWSAAYPLHYLSILFIVLLLSIFIIYYFKLPPPDPDKVSKIFGHAHSKLKIRESSGACHCRFCEASLHENLQLSIIGHRGAGLDAPENSLAAIRACASRGCTMVEFDVSLTRDLVPVLFHDDNLLRIMGVDRKISEINWGDLKQIDISSVDNADGTLERMPTLEEAVDSCLELGMRFIIDIKVENDKLIDTIVKTFQKYGEEAYSRGVISSFYFRVIYKIRARDPNIVGCMAWRPSQFALPFRLASSSFLQDSPICTKILETLLAKVVTPLVYGANDFAVKFVYWRLLGLSALLVHKDALNYELVHRLQETGLRIYAWTVNCPLEKQYFLKKLQIGYLTDTLLDTPIIETRSQNHLFPSPESWLRNNN